MYLVVINVPFRGCGSGAAEVTSDWARSLELLRDSFHGRFGPIVVAAPELPPGDGPIGSQASQRLEAERDDITFVRLGDTRWRARQFWWHHREIRAKCRDLARQADVVHCGINNLWQPYSYFGFRAALWAGATTVFVQDGDAIGRLFDLVAGAAWHRRTFTTLYCRLYYELTRRAVARADLSLLKGHAVNARYAQHARCARDFYNTTFAEDDIIGADALAAKRALIQQEGPIHCLALGRIVDIKGLDHSIAAIAAARQQGAAVELDLIGDGPDEPRLRAFAERLGVAAAVRFCGRRPYGPELLAEVARYHLLLFTSTADETPRALFDGLAGGCGLLAFDLPFTRQVVEEIGHGAVVPRGDTAALAAELVRLHTDRAALAEWVWTAAQAAPEHTAERWYARRAAWTIEAYERDISTKRIHASGSRMATDIHS
ncbi:MAG: glycosyltransferase family 4 protein [Phycisphaerales bacterium]|nr:glycosyltransferase family 4 protein [Phycisphaerales bacterium]